MPGLTPEQSKINQSVYRARMRSNGFGLVNKWIHKTIRDDVYKIIDRINSDFSNDNITFVRMMIDVLTSDSGTEIHGRKVDGKWKFHVIPPNN